MARKRRALVAASQCLAGPALCTGAIPGAVDRLGQVELLPCSALVELCCDADSGLSGLASEYGVTSRRVTAKEDLGAAATVESVQSFLQAHRGADAWAALPCTPWSTWQYINAKRLGPAYCSRLAWRRRQSLKLVRNAGLCFEEARRSGGGCHFEWPRYCAGWRRKPVRDLVKRFGLTCAHFEGCAVGIEAAPGLLAKKPWTVATSRPRLAAELGRLRCSRDHAHGTLRGAAATLSGHYTAPLCRVALQALSEREASSAAAVTGTATTARGQGCCALHEMTSPTAPVEGEPAGMLALPVADGVPSEDVAGDCIHIPEVSVCSYVAPVFTDSDTMFRSTNMNTDCDSGSCTQTSALSVSAERPGADTNTDGDFGPEVCACSLPRGALEGVPPPISLNFDCGPAPAVYACSTPPVEARDTVVSGDGHVEGADPPHPAWELVRRYHEAVLNADNGFSKYLRRFTGASLPKLSGRCRDVLPLPLPALSELAVGQGLGTQHRAAAEQLLCHSAAGLNFLWSGQRARAVPRTASKLQQAVLRRLFTKVLLILEVLEKSVESADSTDAFARVVGRSDVGKYPDLRSDAVDLLERCGGVDPQPSLDASARAVVESETLLFGDAAAELPQLARFEAGTAEEYRRLVVRQLRAGKVALMLRPKAVAATFTIGKKGKDALREIWNGKEITQAAARPPKPPLQANPSALAELEASADRPLWVSGRDARVFFDQLLAPPELLPFLGRPAVLLSELLADETLTREEVGSYLLDGPLPSDDCMLAPVSRVWPMGFGWSSLVAQSHMVRCVEEAGFKRDQLLTEEGCLLPAGSEALSVATDDVLHFLRASPAELEEVARPPLEALDEAWTRLEVLGNPLKSFDLLPSAEVLGVTLRDGTALSARGPRIADLMRGLVDLLGGATASPRELASYGGVLQWHNLLNRPLFSCLHDFYAFTRSAHELEQRAVPPRVLQELCLNVGLMALWSADLSRPWLPCMAATDASGSFGFGVCLASCSPGLSRDVAAHAGAWDHYLRLTPEPGDEPERPRVGRELRLGLGQSHFKRLLAVRARKLEHSGSLEATGVVLGLRRLARRAAWHGHRGAFLVDAQAVRAALQKGRSSAGTLRHQVGQAAALLLACDWRMRFAYLPSESNPADAPSRGKKPASRPLRRGSSARTGLVGRAAREWRRAERLAQRRLVIDDWVDSFGDLPSAGSSSGAARCSPSWRTQ